MIEKGLTTSLISAIMITTDEGKHLKPERYLMKITVETELSLYTITLVYTENDRFTGPGCFGIFSTYDTARNTLMNILKDFDEKLEDKEDIPTGRRYYTNHSTWELEKFKVDDLVL